MLHLPHACTHVRAHTKPEERCINITSAKVQSKLAKELAKTCSSLVEGLVQRHGSFISSMAAVPAASATMTAEATTRANIEA